MFQHCYSSLTTREDIVELEIVDAWHDLAVQLMGFSHGPDSFSFYASSESGLISFRIAPFDVIGRA